MTARRTRHASRAKPQKAARSKTDSISRKSRKGARKTPKPKHIKRVVPPVHPASRRKRPAPNVSASEQQQPQQPRPPGDDERIALRRERAIELKVDGLTYRRIAAQLGVSLGTAYEDVQAEMLAIREHTAKLAEDERGVQLRRLDRAVEGMKKKIAKGDPRAVMALVRVEDRRAKLLGTDAPAKFAPTDPTGTKPYASLTDADLQAHIAERMAQLGKDDDHD